jgi:hypothetical protein
MRPSTDEIEAIERLLRIAQSDTGQSRLVADFLLAWWNAGTCGGFDITATWGLDGAVVEDLLKILRLAARSNSYPDAFGYRDQFEASVRSWRPQLVETK